MKISEVLTRQRKIYTDFLEEQISHCEGSSELLLESKTDEPEEYFRLYRFDCVENIEDEFKIKEFNNDTYINHEPINFSFKGLSIELNPFFWNGCEIELYREIENWESVINWIKEWIEEDEEENAKNGFLSNKIHNFQRPTTANGKIELAIDLGSAEIDALLELIQIFENLGIVKMKIHSDSMLNDD